MREFPLQQAVAGSFTHVAQAEATSRSNNKY